MTSRERRSHPRCVVRLPLVHRPAHDDGALPKTGQSDGYTSDIGPGGVRFVTSCSAIQIGDRILLEVSVPPGEGTFPYGGKVLGTGTVARCSLLDAGPVGRWSVAAKFDEPLSLDF